MITINVRWDAEHDGTVSDAFICRPASAAMTSTGVQLRGTAKQVLDTVYAVLRTSDPRHATAVADVLAALAG